jgi:hypothetical protein
MRLMLGENGQDQFRLGRHVTQIVKQQHAAVRMPIAMNQGAHVMILGQEDAPFGGGFRQQRLIAWVRRSFAGIEDIVTGVAKRAHRLRDDVRIGEDVHAIRRRS